MRSQQIKIPGKLLCQLNLFGMSNYRTTCLKGDVTNASKASNIGTWKHHTGHPSWAKFFESQFSTRIETQGTHQRCNRTYTKKEVNSQLKLLCEQKRPKTTDTRVLCGEHPWASCNQSYVSLLCLSIGTKSWRQLTQKFSLDNIYELPTLKLLKILVKTYIRPRNLAFSRHVFFSRKQKKLNY